MQETNESRDPACPCGPSPRGGREAQVPTRSSPRTGRQPTRLARVSTGLCGQATNQRNCQPSTSARQQGTGCRVPVASSANGAPRAGPGAWAVTRGELAAQSSPRSGGPAPQSQHISFQRPPPEEGPPTPPVDGAFSPGQAGWTTCQAAVGARASHRLIPLLREQRSESEARGEARTRGPLSTGPAMPRPAPSSRAPHALARS